MKELLLLFLPQKNKLSHHPAVSRIIQGMLAMLGQGIKQNPLLDVFSRGLVHRWELRGVGPACCAGWVCGGGQEEGSCFPEETRCWSHQGGTDQKHRGVCQPWSHCGGPFCFPQGTLAVARHRRGHGLGGRCSVCLAWDTAVPKDSMGQVWSLSAVNLSSESEQPPRAG